MKSSSQGGILLFLFLGGEVLGGGETLDGGGTSAGGGVTFGGSEVGGGDAVGASLGAAGWSSPA